jgi:predicted ribosomally synthesized six-cysteine peptide SCIFF
MKHIKVLAKNVFKKEHEIGCGECQSSCQSACKTSCTVGNQSCKQDEKITKAQKKDN